MKKSCILKKASSRRAWGLSWYVSKCPECKRKINVRSPATMREGWNVYTTHCRHCLQNLVLFGMVSVEKKAERNVIRSKDHEAFARSFLRYQGVQGARWHRNFTRRNTLQSRGLIHLLSQDPSSIARLLENLSQDFADFCLATIVDLERNFPESTSLSKFYPIAQEVIKNHETFFQTSLLSPFADVKFNFGR